MNSLFITTSRIKEGTGGGIVTKNILQSLKSISEVTVLSYDDITPSKFGYSEIPFLTDYFTSHIISEIISDHKDHIFDIVHIYGNPFGITVKMLSNFAKNIIVDVPAHNVEESIAEHQKMGIPYNYPHMTQPYLWSLYTEHIKKARHIIFPSTYSLEYLKNKLDLNITNRHLEVIPYGCDIPDKVTPIPDQFTVGHLSVFGPDKGQIYLLKAWANLGYSDNELWLAGQDETTIKTLIYSTNANHPINDSPTKYRVFGYIPDVNSFYKNISVYVQPSVTEGFGVEVLEAMSHGRPVIVTEGVGAKDLVINGVNGYIVPIRNPEAIADKLKYLKDHPDEIKHLGLAARKTSEKYSWNNIRMKYKQLYETLTENN